MPDIRISAHKEKSRIDVAVLLAIIFHLFLALWFISAKPKVRKYTDLKEITFLDQSYRPEVAKILPTPTPQAGGSFEKNVPEPTPGAPSSSVPIEEPAVDLSSRLERSQAAIDLNRYELNRDEALDVIRIGNKGEMKSTEEILEEKPIALARGIRTGVPGLVGFLGVKEPQEPEIKIEHRPLEKAKVEIKPEIPKAPIEPAQPVTKGTKISIAGPISGRQIINKVLPQYPEWALRKGLSGTVVLRLWVLPEGMVKTNVQVEQSSGYPELDQIVISALTRWQFAPLAKDVLQETQWGIITFRFTLL